MFPMILLNIYVIFDYGMSPHPCKRGADLNVRVRKRTLENLHAKTYKCNLLQSHDKENILNFH